MRKTMWAVLLGLALGANGCLCGDGGTVCFVPVANSSFDQYTSSPGRALKAWFRAHYRRMLVYAPYFNGRLAWSPRGWVYKDLYAIYVGGAVAQAHPEWILKDRAGNWLYIPYACSGGSCPQYAADIGNPGFRAFWIDEARAVMAPGYKGVFEDDCNFRLQVGYGDGSLAIPYDPRLRRDMSDADWRHYLAGFTEQIRAAFPHPIELVQNQVWWFAPNGHPYVSRAQRAADYVWIERGFNDTGITGGAGQYGFETLLEWIDIVHANGAGTVEEIEVDWGREYSLAMYFLTSYGDGYSNRNGGTPADWWQGYDVRLGSPIGGQARYRWHGLWRRDFKHGFVLANEPGARQVSVQLGGRYLGLDRQWHTTATIGAADGRVFVAPRGSPT